MSHEVPAQTNRPTITGMSDTQNPDSLPVVKSPLGLKSEEEDEKKQSDADMNGTDRKEVMVVGVHVEPSTLPWPIEKSNPPAVMGKATSDLKLESGEIEGRSDCAGGVSRTESEREFESQEKGEMGEGWTEKDQPDFRKKAAQLEEVLEELENSLPEKAARVFSPNSMPESGRRSSVCFVEDLEKRPFLGPHGTPPDGYCHDYHQQKNSQCCGCSGTNRDVLKMAVSIFMSALIFPVLVWGGHTFLPFDAPVLDSASLRLVYTLRCSVFAVIPIVLGVLVLGLSRLRYHSLTPRCDGVIEVEEVNVHRRYVDDSISLFLLYFLQLGVMAAYLNQSLLKLVPLLTIVFAFGRLIYWIAAVFHSSVRGFGFGFSFLPMLTMLVANLYFIFISDSSGSIFALDDAASAEIPQEHRQRLWG